MSAYYQFTLGEFDATVLSDGGGTRPAEHVFSNVDRQQLHSELQQHGFGLQIETGLNVLAVQTPDGLVLVDAGLSNGRLIESMQAAGIAPDDVDHLIITHGDGDHVGGLNHFTNARIYLAQLAWELWTDADSLQHMVDEWDQALGSRFEPAQREQRLADRRRYGAELLPSLGERLTLVIPEQEFLPGFKLHYAPGHRSDHYAVEITSDKQQLLHVADALRHPLQALNPDRVDGYSNYPQQCAATARSLLARAADYQMLLFCTHLAFPGLATVKRQEGHFVMQPWSGTHA